MTVIKITKDVREADKITSADIGKVLTVVAGGIEPTAVADISQLAEADENKVLIVNASGLPEGYFPAAGKVGIMTEAGFVEITPVADVTDFTVAVGDLISTSNGVVTKLEEGSVTPVADVTDFVVAPGDLISVTNGIITKLEHAE